ncbi:hypothetical protein MMB232_00553 [Brevundimonas subvibrioides]|uniref:Argininosuccinate lyase n=1 Tax=Brevundimonas subvibrioides (strain ATCC 15264 / DSM 4735 / LMG 14903 / NBRC 16000 / CB 81) TaxID=633149 RepID=D9QL74_BRESC|nr:hypothetical protein [Brevundimonas subvibrioides]ADK99929.1 conserved hypothetical protein [Brevundimonas subvibrioides ATCC 15264]
MKKLIVAGALALTALAAAGCGRMADLETPGPRETERAPRDARAPDLPDPATVNRPSSQIPIDGGPSNPFGSPAAARDPR